MSNSAENVGQAAPLIAHVVHRFDYGGLENGLVNIINTMDKSAYRHAVIALTETTEFARRIARNDSIVYSLHKRPGKDIGVYHRLWTLLRQLRPAILHTRNIGTMDCVPVGRLAGISLCIHGEHGWDTHDPDGKLAKYRRIRRVLNPLVAEFVTVSRHLERWLVDEIGISPAKVTTIHNGVDTRRFYRVSQADRRALPDGFTGNRVVIVGTITRFEAIKDPLNLVRAYKAARAAVSDSGIDLRLVMIGDGTLRRSAENLIASSGLSSFCWLPGVRDNVPELLHCFDVFVLSSRREGISNTILEAMASGLPVVATRTGGNPELIREEESGKLVEPENPEQLANAIARYARSPDLRQQHGETARRSAENSFSLIAMAESYRQLYTAALARRGS